MSEPVIEAPVPAGTNTFHQLNPQEQVVKFVHTYSAPPSASANDSPAQAPPPKNDELEDQLRQLKEATKLANEQAKAAKAEVENLRELARQQKLAAAGITSEDDLKYFKFLTSPDDTGKQFTEEEAVQKILYMRPKPPWGQTGYGGAYGGGPAVITQPTPDWDRMKFSQKVNLLKNNPERYRESHTQYMSQYKKVR